MPDKAEFSLRTDSVQAKALTASADHEITALPAWHVRHQEYLKGALARIGQSSSPAISAIAQACLLRMPCRVRASMTEDETAAQIMDLVEAISQRYVSPNSLSARNALLFKLGPGWKERWVALPDMIRPMIVTDAVGPGRFAILWLSTPVITSAKGRTAPQALADQAEILMAEALGASRLAALSLVGSPWAIRQDLPDSATPAQPVWKILPGAGPVELRAVIKLLSPQAGPDFGEDCDKTTEFYNTPGAIRTTNQHLFDEVRKHFRNHPSPDLKDILAYALAVNKQFPRPVARLTVDEMCERIHGYLQKKRASRAAHPTRRRDPSETPRQAQARAGRETGKIRFEATSRLLVSLVAEWPRNRELTQTALAMAAGVSERTIRTHWNQIILTGSSLPLSGSTKHLTRTEILFNGKTLSDLVSHRKTELEDLAYYESYKRDLRRFPAVLNCPDTPASGGDNPEIAQAYRDAEAAFEKARKRFWKTASMQRRSGMKAARQQLLREAGMRNDISVRERALSAVPARLARLQPYLEKEYHQERIPVLLKIIRANMVNKIEADYRIGVMARTLREAQPSPIAPRRCRMVHRPKPLDQYLSAMFRVLRKPASGVDPGENGGHTRFCKKLMHHLVHACGFDVHGVALLRKKIVEALRIGATTRSLLRDSSQLLCKTRRSTSRRRPASLTRDHGRWRQQPDRR